MALLAGDIVQLSMNGTLFGETCSNVFFYECLQNAGVATLGHVCALFGIDIGDTWLPLVSEDYDLVDIRADNLTNLLDFYVYGITGSGGTISPSASSAVAGSLALQVETRLTRPGSKRMAGIPEVDIAANIWTPDGTDIGVLLTALSAELDLNDLGSPVDCQLQPVIVGRFPIEHEDAGKIDVSRFQPVVSADFRSLITTQTSRRAGRGS